MFDLLNHMIENRNEVIKSKKIEVNRKCTVDEGKVPLDKDSDPTKVKKLTESFESWLEKNKGDLYEEYLRCKDQGETQSFEQWAKDRYEALELDVEESKTNKELTEDSEDEHELGNGDPDKISDAPVAEPKVDATPTDETPEEKVEIEKEYVGNTEDIHYYLVGTNDDLQIVDQEGVMKYSAKDHNIDPQDPTEFIIRVINEVEIDQITRSIFTKYILPRLEEEDEEEEKLEDELEDGDEKKPEIEVIDKEKEEPMESKKVNEDVNIVINTDNEAFSEDKGPLEVSRILRKLADNIAENGLEDRKPLIDINGNTVGEAIWEKKSPTKCKKCGKKHWAFRPCKGKGKKVNESTIDIMFSDLSGEKQKEILDAYGVKDPKEMNWDIIPFDTIDTEDIEKCKESVQVNEDLDVRDMPDDKLEQTLKSAEDLMKQPGADKLFPGVNDIILKIKSEINIRKNKKEEGKVPLDKDSDPTKVKKLMEMKVNDGENEFNVYLGDDGSLDTVIDINGREFRFDQEFASMWRDESGALSDDGLKELALNALSGLDEEEYQELATSRGEDSEFIESKKSPTANVIDVRESNKPDEKEENIINEKLRVGDSVRHLEWDVDGEIDRVFSDNMVHVQWFDGNYEPCKVSIKKLKKISPEDVRESNKPDELQVGLDKFKKMLGL